jgi:MscS family membrane protein
MNPKCRNQYPPIFQKILVACRLFFFLLLSLLLSSPVRAASLQDYPLLPVNTSGPRGTLRTFLTNAENAFAEFKKSGYRSKEAIKYIQRAASTLDMSHVPLTAHEDVAFEYTLRLKEILANIEVPELESVPLAEDFKDTDDYFWRIPNTNITIAKISEGPRKGAWLFTPDTVSRIPDYYRLIKEKRGADQTAIWTFERYIYAPGWMIPAGLIDALPKWMGTSVFEQALWQWIGLLLALSFGGVVLIWTYRGWQGLQTKLNSVTRRWRWERLVYPVFGYALVYALHYFIDEQVNITGEVLVVIAFGLQALAIGFASWVVLVFGDTCNEGLVSIQKIKSTSIAADVTRLVIRVLSFIVVFILFYNAADRLGIPVNAVFASAGIAGFAVAMAAKDSLSNLFGGVTIFLDRPFRTGDYIVLDNDERGEVMQIGLRSTRIKTRDDIMITIPNSIITNTKIVNQSSPEPMFRVRIQIGVAYGSDIKQVETILIGQARSNPLAAQDPEPRVRFRNFGYSALEFELLCWAKRPHDRGRLTHELNTGIYHAFDQAGVEIPFPQRDVHLKNES